MSSSFLPCLQAHKRPPMCGASYAGVPEAGGQFMSLLYSPVTLGPYTFKNRIVMSPMTRSRALGNVPDGVMVEYYKQRASSAGLIITEGTSPSPNGLGYPRIPGIFSAAQVVGWKKIADAVHSKGAKIF